MKRNIEKAKKLYSKDEFDKEAHYFKEFFENLLKEEANLESSDEVLRGKLTRLYGQVKQGDLKSDERDDEMLSDGVSSVSYGSAYGYMYEKKKGKFSFNTNYFKNIENIKNIEPTAWENIFIDQSDLAKVTDEFIEKTKDCALYVNVDYNQDSISYDDLFKLLQIEQKRKKMNGNRTLSTGLCEIFDNTAVAYSIKHVINANMQLDSWADKINNATFLSRKLTPLEKYMCAYEIVTNFAKYNIDEEAAASQSRYITNILNKDISNGNICCVGYASLLTALCSRIGINCMKQTEFIYEGGIDNKNVDANHAVCRVYIDDPKYNIKGLFHSDPCWDSINDDDISNVFFALNNVDRMLTGPVKNGYRRYSNAERGMVSPKAFDSLFPGKNFDQTVRNNAEIFFTISGKMDFLKRTGMYPSDEVLDNVCAECKDRFEISDIQAMKKALEVINSNQVSIEKSANIDSFSNSERMFIEELIVKYKNNASHMMICGLGGSNQKTIDATKREQENIKAMISDDEKLQKAYYLWQRENLAKAIAAQNYGKYATSEKNFSQESKKAILYSRDLRVGTASIVANIALHGDSKETKDRIIRLFSDTKNRKKLLDNVSEKEAANAYDKIKEW